LAQPERLPEVPGRRVDRHAPLLTTADHPATPNPELLELFFKAAGRDLSLS
jgi:hypothetical protein